VALVLEQPLLANRPALAALLKRVRADVRRADWVGRTAVDRLELLCRDTSREQASKMLLRLAEHFDATFPLAELNSPSDEKAGVGREGGRRGRRGPPRRRRMRVGWSRRGCHVDLHRSPSRNFAASRERGVGNADAVGRLR
jgi:hypothetical protein